MTTLDDRINQTATAIRQGDLVAADAMLAELAADAGSDPRVLRLRADRAAARGQWREALDLLARAVERRAVATGTTRPSAPEQVLFGLGGPVNQRLQVGYHIKALEWLLTPRNMLFMDNMLLLVRAAAFLEDESLQAVTRKYATSDVDRSIIWRTHTLLWAARHCLGLPGDFVECGTHLGYSALCINDYLGLAGQGRHFWLYDLFDGSAYGGTPAADDPLAFVQGRFAGQSHVHIVKGPVPHSLIGNSPDRIAFLHIDMNNVEAEMGALNALFDRVTPGGMIILDDYGYAFFKDQQVAEKRFFDDRNLPVLELPTGQALIIKG